MGLFSRRRRQHADAVQMVSREYIAPVHAAAAPYVTGTAAFFTSAALSSAYSPYVGGAAGLGITLAGGEVADYWGTVAARGDGYTGDRADAYGDANRERTYEAGMWGTLIGTLGTIDLSVWGLQLAQGYNYYQTYAPLFDSPRDPSYSEGREWGWGMEGLGYYGHDIPGTEHQSPMLDEEDDEDDKPKKSKRRKRRFQVTR